MKIVIGCNIIGHDTTFAFIKNGKLEYVLEEERFNRHKHSFSYSTIGLEYGLNKLNIKKENINFVANFMDENILKGKNLYNFKYQNINELEENRKNFLSQLEQYKHKLLDIFPKEKIINVRHHMAHCAGVFYPSEFKNAAILSIDGRGEIDTTVIAFGNEKDIQILESIYYPHSLGHFYDAITYWLGWGFGEEGKTMALAAYGKPKYYKKFLDKLIEFDEDGKFFIKIPYTCEKRFQNIIELLGPRRKRDEQITQYHKDIAATTQKITEEIILRLVKYMKKIIQSENLIITGGVALNSVANKVILNHKIFKNFMVYPQSNDIGSAIGAGFYVYYNLLCSERKNYYIFKNPYLGADIDIENINKTIEKYNLNFKRFSTYQEIIETAAEEISKNKVIGWVQGRAEIGRRALGNRSILANPLYQEAKDIVNKKVKFREPWRPFAPSVLCEDANNFFDIDTELPYMTIVTKIKDNWKDKLKSIVHIDGTVRVQTVKKDLNPLYYQLLQKIKEKIGIGMVLNTSFNVNKEPIVNTVENAIEDFLRTDMDSLIIDRYYFTKENIKIKLSKFSVIEENLKRIKNKYNIFKLNFLYFNKSAIKNVNLISEIKEKCEKLNINYNFSIFDNEKRNFPVILILEGTFQGYSGMGDKEQLKTYLKKVKDISTILFFIDQNGIICKYNDLKFYL